jgi:glycosyltransferase involved in cell wall biosynthesis
MRILTTASAATMPQVRVLARSLARHQPDWPLEVVLIDRHRVEHLDGEPLTTHSAAEDLQIDLVRLLAVHGEEVLRRLLLPRLLAVHAERAGGPVVHLPPSAWVLGSLEPVAEALSRRGVMLASRARGELPDDGLQPTVEHLHRAGRVADLLIGVDGGAGGQGFLAWWAARVEQMLGSLDGTPSRTRPEDRPWLARYLELAPARLSAAMLDDPGCNLSMWNLPEHELSGGAEGVVVDGRWPLRFLDLPGFDPTRPYRLNPLASRVRVSRSPALRELCAQYAEELLRAGWRDLDRRAEVGRSLGDGLVFDEALRALYMRALAVGEDFGDLFAGDGDEAFLAWLEGPAPLGARHGISRYVFYRVARERPDVMRAYPDLDGGDGEGYVAWCWAFGRNELGLPERFLAPRAGSVTAPAPAAGDPAADVGEPAPRPAAEPVPDTASAPAAGEPFAAVRVTGYLGHSLGLGAAARGYARALEAAGVPVSTNSVPLHHLAVPVELASGYGRHTFEDLLHDGGHGFELVAVNADELPDFVERLGPDYFEGPRIGIWGWETNAIPDRWQRAFGLVAEIWVYSRFMAENIGAVAPVPVIALPPPVQAPATPAAPLRLGVPEGFLFLFVFDYLSTIQRKNPVGLIEAFKRAFAPGEGPQLLIKTINGPLRPLAEEEVLWAADGRPDIHVVDRSLSGEELNGLMAACDCYVSLHRSEGFGLTIAEAMALGKPVIATGYSGNVDFMDEHNSFPVDWTLALVGPECEIYPAEGEWADPSIEHAAAQMRLVHDDPARAAAAGGRAREDIARILSPEVTGAAMRRRLQELSSGA